MKREGPSPEKHTYSRVKPPGVTSLRIGSVGVEVPLLIGPFTPPLTAPEPVVLCARSPFALLETPPVFGTIGAVAVGEAPWFGAGVGEPRLSYCIWAEATPLLISKAAAAKIKECVFIFPSLCSRQTINQW
jgi:hypothetical protein